MNTELLHEDIDEEFLRNVSQIYFFDGDCHNFSTHLDKIRGYVGLGTFYINTKSPLPLGLPWNFYIQANTRNIEKEFLVSVVAVVDKYFNVISNINPKCPLILQNIFQKEYPVKPGTKIRIPWNLFYFWEIPNPKQDFRYKRECFENRQGRSITTLKIINQSMFKDLLN